ncbi:transcriptional regulator [Streptococcus suis]|uniref:transcriptional regulator n=1 Tax=Streptococcus suis TaxID=1307 RepID=UPI001553D293|nr:transcriptional regulator [Streptococcus suis]NQO33669.1 transcriptional regulator [Streptococcus suis]HEM2864881.1 transcriptional regulator [Streptococcus suis]HEM5083221.1 transcriptional regulator [Streptococcus suis]HEM5150641.1 transcriptional regulator [Streptococcus suis]
MKYSEEVVRVPTLVKLVIDDLANRNSKAFQIAVEEEDLGTWKLYKRRIVYL